MQGAKDERGRELILISTPQNNRLKITIALVSIDYTTQPEIEQCMVRT